MTYGFDGILTVTSEGGIRVITLNDPDRLNAMTDPLHEALTDVWVHITRDEQARVVVLTGPGGRSARAATSRGLSATSRTPGTAGPGCARRGCWLIPSWP